VAWRQAGPTAAAVMRWKLTFGMILLSTSAMILSMSPERMDLSALMAPSTSPEMRCTKASGASSAARAGETKKAAALNSRALARASRPMWRRCTVAVEFMVKTVPLANRKNGASKLTSLGRAKRARGS
jgi:hypothetical protein